MGEAIRAIVLPKRMNRIQTMTVGVVLPASRRDLRLDLFRGLANWANFLGHISDTARAVKTISDMSNCPSPLAG
jgi:hypothetical protein